MFFFYIKKYYFNKEEIDIPTYINKTSLLYKDDYISPIISDYDNTTETSNFQKHVYSDAIKWLVYHSIIDADVKTTIYSNGYVEFYCPRIGKRFFEKFYKIDKKTNKIISYEYGVATYVMDDNDYINNRQILVDQLSDDMEAINPVVLSELVPKGKKNRIPHITQSRTKNWIRQMASEFGSIYSEKDQEELLVLEYENQHEIMD